MLVVDTSAIVDALVGQSPKPQLITRLSTDADLHAPHLLDVELLHALRRLVSTGRLSEDRAAEARADFADMVILRYPHQPLADRVWELRHNVGAYDATFLALAEALEVPLVTCDARLARAQAHHANIELFSAP
jgi:predicted nucleic acid-binding protein